MSYLSRVCEKIQDFCFDCLEKRETTRISPLKYSNRIKFLVPEIFSIFDFRTLSLIFRAFLMGTPSFWGRNHALGI